MAKAVKTGRADRPKGYVGELGAAIRFNSPIVFGIMFLSLLVYNPSNYDFFDLVRVVVFDGAGSIEGVPWYKQPAYYGLALLAIITGAFLWFKWEIARNEIPYLIIFLLASGFVVGFAVFGAEATYHLAGHWLDRPQMVGVEFMTLELIHWITFPIVLGAIAFAATMPRARRMALGAVTVGGGEVSTDSDTLNDADHC
jgi:hypothetical protein